MNLLESLFKVVRDPKPPLHVGEVMTLWTYQVALDEGRAFCMLMINHTADHELKRLMERFIAEVEEPQLKELKTLLRNEGINLPPVSADKAKADEKEIPPGAKLTDGEIANLFQGKIIFSLQTLGNGMIQCLRTDIAGMLYRYQAALLREGFMLRETMMNRGWLKIPPYYPSEASAAPK